MALFDVEKTAVDSISEDIEVFTSETGLMLYHVLNKIDCSIQCIVNDNNTAQQKVSRKITRRLAKINVELADKLDPIITRLLLTIHDMVATNDWLLKQVLIKAHKLNPGQEVTLNIYETIERKSDCSFIGTVMLDISKLVPMFGELIKVLMEIRDRMPNAESVQPDEKSPHKAIEATDELIGFSPKDDSFEPVGEIIKGYSEQTI